MSEITKESTDDRLNGDQAVEVAALVLAGFACLPVALAWIGAPLLGRSSFFWRREGMIRGAFKLVVVPAAFLGLYAIWQWWLPVAVPMWKWPIEDSTEIVLAVAFLWACLLPLAFWIVMLRISDLANELERGELTPASADLIRRARDRAGLGDGRYRAQRLPSDRPDSVVVAAVVRADFRPVLSRRFAGRDRGGKSAMICRRRRLSGKTSEFLTVATASAPRIGMLASSGAGKTTFLRRICVAWLQLGGRVLWLDGKGDLQDQSRLVEAARQAAIPDDAIRQWPANAFDAWRGSSDDVVAKVSALLDDPTGDAAYHHRRDVRAVRIVASAEPPLRSSAELLDRLWQPRGFVDNERDWMFLKNKLPGRPPQHQVSHDRIQDAFQGIHEFVDGRDLGWSFDDPDWQMATCPIQTESHIRAALVILADLMGHRVRPHEHSFRPTLVVIDEGQVVLDHPQAPKLATAFEWFRSAGIGLVVASQSVEGLGEQGGRILRSGATIFAGRGLDPDELVRLGGTRKRAEVAFDPLTGAMSSAREQDQFSIDPTLIRMAGPGEFALMEPGQAARWVVVPQ